MRLSMNAFYEAIRARFRFCIEEMKGRKALGTALTALLPLSFGLFPILFLYAGNTAVMSMRAILVPSLWVCGSALLGTVVAGFALKSFQKGSLVAAMILFSFFSYGHVLRILPDVQIPLGRSSVGIGLLLLVAWCALIGVAVVLIGRTKKDLKKLCILLMEVGAALVLLQAARAGYFLSTRGEARITEAAPAPAPVTVSVMATEARQPDIYYIVVDAYGRDDVLKEIYGVDNSDFLSFLRAKGFFIPQGSWTHYCQTVYSIGAVLNMDYIDALGDFDAGMTDREPAAELLKKNRTIRLLKNEGYSTAAFFSGYLYSEIEDADVFLKPSGVLEEFENVLLSTTMLPAAGLDENPSFTRHRRMVAYALNKLPEVTEVKSPKFVFAHIVSPHPPFVFNAEGPTVPARKYYDLNDGDHYRNTQGSSRSEYIEGYSGQVVYLTKLLKITIQKILENSGENKPVIIIQGDHGPGSGLYWESPEKTDMKERMGILFAYCLPGQEGKPQYDGLSPINVFRAVFNIYFGARFPYLPNRHYFMRYSRPYDFIEVTDRLNDLGQP
jgi:hypothetical protein